MLARKAPRGWSTGNSLDLTDREDSIVRVAQTIRRADRHPAGNRTVPSINLGRCALGSRIALNEKLENTLTESLVTDLTDVGKGSIRFIRSHSDLVRVEPALR